MLDVLAIDWHQALVFQRVDHFFFNAEHFISDRLDGDFFSFVQQRTLRLVDLRLHGFEKTVELPRLFFLGYNCATFLWLPLRRINLTLR